MKEVNKRLQCVRISNRSGSHVNCFRYRPNRNDVYNGDDFHEDAKFKVFKVLRKKDHDVIVEPIFNDGSRADLLDLTDGHIYEIKHTESQMSIDKKTLKYPSIFGFTALNALDVLKEGWIL